MSGPALDQDQIEARRRARQDLAELEDATRESRTAEREAARREALEVAIKPLNKAILHGRKTFKVRRARNKVAKRSRARNR